MKLQGSSVKHTSLNILQDLLHLFVWYVGSPRWCNGDLIIFCPHSSLVQQQSKHTTALCLTQSKNHIEYQTVLGRNTEAAISYKPGKSIHLVSICILTPFV